MLARIALAVVVAVVVFLGCVFLGGLFSALEVSIAAVVGEFLTRWATVISVLAGIWYFFRGGGFTITRT